MKHPLHTESYSVLICLRSELDNEIMVKLDDGCNHLRVARVARSLLHQQRHMSAWRQLDLSSPCSFPHRQHES